MPRFFVLHEYATTFNLMTYHCDLYEFVFQAGHGDNVRGGTAQRRGVVECMQQVFFDASEFAHQNKTSRFSLAVFIYVLFELHASTTPLMQIRFSVAFAPPFNVQQNSVTGFP